MITLATLLPKLDSFPDPCVSNMPILPVSHYEWQVLRTVKRSKKPPTGRALRLVPNRRTKDGSFLNEMVERGLLTRVTGTEQAPFEATYVLTERGEYAAEYGECEFPMKAKGVEPPVPEQPQPTKAKRQSGSRKSR